MARGRIRFLDELRGLCILLMVCYHSFYVLGYLFNLSVARALFDFFTPIQPFFAGIFILICGISCHLSHSNIKRGLFLAAIAGLVSLVMWCAIFWGVLAPDSYVWFGILHCLATCVLLYTLLRPTLQLIPPFFGVIVSGALLLLCWHVPFYNGSYFGIDGIFALPIPLSPPNTPWLYPLGLCPVYNASDYFPLIPWLFCFLMGTYIGVWAKKGKFPKTLYRSRVPFLATIGRYTLWIYVLHQPIIYGLCFIIDATISAVF